jgi:hypothetical protein
MAPPWHDLVMRQPDLFDIEVVPLFEEHRADWLARARAVAYQICLDKGSATIDEVRARCPPPADVDPRVMGAVFRTRDFVSTDHIKSTRRNCHNRPIVVFVLKEGRR